MPKVTEEHLEARRTQILDAAVACFSRNGFHQTTIQDICSEAGLSPGAVYRYFDSKEAMIGECCMRGQEETAMAFEGAASQCGTQDVIAQLADIFFGELASPEAPPALRLHVQLWGESLRKPEILAGLSSNRDGVRQHLQAVVERGQSLGDVDLEADPEYVARVLLSAYDGLVLQKCLDPDVDIFRYVGAFKSLVAGVLSGASAGGSARS
jgi:AcrR family transcriptional regulator